MEFRRVIPLAVGLIIRFGFLVVEAINFEGAAAHYPTRQCRGLFWRKTVPPCRN